MGLTGEAISLEELAQHELFRGGSSFRARLRRCFQGPVGDDGTPREIRAAVRRVFEPDQVICEAGSYGSTAFYLLEGTARAVLPERATRRSIPGRSRSGTRWLRDVFTRRTADARIEAAATDPIEIGEVTAHASLPPERPEIVIPIETGDLFGVDTCINFYPRERTVIATSRCVVVEMLRSVVDAIRSGGAASDPTSRTYQEQAVANLLSTSSFGRHLDDDAFEELAASSVLLVPGTEEFAGPEIYDEGSDADCVYFVRSGHVRLSRRIDDREVTFAYVGRGSSFGWEAVFPHDEAPLELECRSHPEVFSPVVLASDVTFGRKADCQVVFPREVSTIGRRHCRIEVRDGEAFLVRWESQSPTFLNDHPVDEAIIMPGDEIRIGPYKFEVRSSTMDLTESGPPRRRARADGLDNFEVVRVPASVLRAQAVRNDRLQAHLEAIARSGVAAGERRTQPPPAALEPLVESGLYNAQNVFLIDLDRCTRCDECVRACADAHDGIARFTRDGPRLGRHLVVMACRSCTDPKCMIGCPVGSIRREDSLQIRIEDWCIGCQSCARQCPYGNINMVDLGTSGSSAAAPVDTGSSMLRATVCDLCAGWQTPNCVYACPHDAAIRVQPVEFLSAGGRT